MLSDKFRGGSSSAIIVLVAGWASGAAATAQSLPPGLQQVKVAATVSVPVTSASFYNTANCTSTGLGVYLVTAAPKRGQLTLNTKTNVLDSTSDACAGQTFPGVEVSYTWNSTSPGATQDYFQLSLTDPAGNVTIQNWLAVLAAPPSSLGPGKLTFTNPYAMQIANNEAPPSIDAATAPTAPAAQAISADGLSPAVIVYVSSSSQPVVFSADSASGVLLSSYLPNYLQISSTPSGLTNPLHTSIPPICIGQTCTVVAMAWPPAHLSESSSSGSGSFPPVAAHITATQGNQAVESILFVYPPPLLLVHDLWSSADAAGFSALAGQGGFFSWISSQYPHNLMFPVDYRESDTKSFDDPDVQSQFEITVERAIYNANNGTPGQSVVARSVDVVAHGMGALVARWYLWNSATPAGYVPPYLISNPVHSLITIGAPHLGTGLATALWQSRNNIAGMPSAFTPGIAGSPSTLVEDLCFFGAAAGTGICSLNNVISLLGMPADTGLESIQESGLSPQLNVLIGAQPTNVPSPFRTIAGATVASLPGNHIPGPSEALWDNLLGLFAPPDTIATIFSGIDGRNFNDTFAAIPSQDDQPPNTPYPLGLDRAEVENITHVSLCGPCETSETASPNVWKQTLFWLENGQGPAPGSAVPIYVAGGPGQEPRAATQTPSAPLLDLTGYTSVDASNVSFTPASKSTLSPHVPVNITVTSTKTITEILLFQQVADPSDVPLYYATASPFSISYTPIRIGTANFIAFALFSDKTYTVTTLTYTLQPPGPITGLYLVDPPGEAVAAGRSFAVHAVATYAEGAVDVTHAAHYVARVAATPVFSLDTNNRITTIGQGPQTLEVSYGGKDTSATIKTFCAFVLSPSNQVIPNTGGAVQIQLTTVSQCPWTATLDSTWITFGNKTGLGSTTINLSASANPFGFVRTATVSVGNQSVLISQPFTPCSYTVSSANINAPLAGSSGTIAVTTASSCPVIASSNATWLTASVNGTTVSYGVAPNPTSASRTAVLSISGQLVSVTQSALAACTYSVSPAAINANASGTSGSISVTTTASCPIIPASDSDWVTVGVTGSTVTYTVAPNPATATRNAMLTINGQQVAVSQAAAAVPTGPVIADNGVVNAANFTPGLTSGTWISILGTNLSSTTRSWESSDFQGTNLPTSLDGVRVLVNGLPAYVYYISPKQLNVLAPADSAMGTVPVQVINSQGSSNIVNVNKQAFFPALFAYSLQSGRYAVAQDGVTYGLIGPSGLSPAKPGEVLLLYGTGLGSTNPPYPEGQIIQHAAPTANTLQVKIGGVSAKVAFAGIIEAGLYQINVVVPDNLPSGDAAVTMTVGQTQSATQVYIPIQ